MFESVRFEKDYALLNFNFTGGGLVARDLYGYLKGFEIAGEDRVFHYAQASIVQNRVKVEHPKGLRPVAVRYAWANAPQEANLFNQEGFPACPFRTDDWQGVTVRGKFE